jgi:hypothetical protein
MSLFTPSRPMPPVAAILIRGFATFVRPRGENFGFGSFVQTLSRLIVQKHAKHDALTKCTTLKTRYLLGKTRNARFKHEKIFFAWKDKKRMSRCVNGIPELEMLNRK